MSEQEVSKGASLRCFIEFKVSLAGTRIKLAAPARFKAVFKSGLDYYLVVELSGSPTPEYEVEIMSVEAMRYIPKAAQYIDTVAQADGKLRHFIAQPPGASTSPATELPIAEVRAPNRPLREEDLLRRRGALK